MKSAYVLTKGGLHYLQTLGIGLICRRCQMPIVVGDTIIRKGKGDKSRRLYHQVCYDSLFLDTNDDENEEEKT